MHRIAVALLVLLAGCAGAPLAEDRSDGELELVERWTAGESSIGGNHHAVAAGRVGEEPVIAAPIGGHHGEQGCMLLVLNGTGAERWHAEVPKGACTIHAVADPALVDFLGDARPELLAATTEEAVVAYDPVTGERLFRHRLSDYGYTRPVVTDVLGDAGPELVITDVDGTLSVVRPDNSTVWSRPLDAYSWSPPAVADFDDAPGTEIVLGLGNGSAIAFSSDGSVAWTATVEGSITWTAAGDVDGDPAREFLAGTAAGTVAAIDGRDGSVEWTRSFSQLAAVGPPFDGDDDGTLEVYATDRNGTLYALAGPSGETEWRTQLTDAGVQMTPPPVAGDVTGDGVADLVAVTNDGTVQVVDPADGTVRATYARDAAIYTHATLADTDGDGIQEVYVMYGDGTVAALDGQTSRSS